MACAWQRREKPVDTALVRRRTTGGRFGLEQQQTLACLQIARDTGFQYQTAGTTVCAFPAIAHHFTSRRRLGA